MKMECRSGNAAVIMCQPFRVKELEDVQLGKWSSLMHIMALSTVNLPASIYHLSQLYSSPCTWLSKIHVLICQTRFPTKNVLTFCGQEMVDLIATQKLFIYPTTLFPSLKRNRKIG